MPEYVLMYLNMPEHYWILLDVPEYGFQGSHLIIFDIWHEFEHASGIKYARVLKMLQYNYNNIILIAVINVIILEFLSARFVHSGTPQCAILSFF